MTRIFGMQLAVAVACLVGSVAALAQDRGRYTITYCNSTNIPIVYVAVALFDRPTDSRPTVQGWTPVPQGQCRDWTRDLGSSAKRTVWYRAEGDIVREGGATRYVLAAKLGTDNFCVRDKHTPGYVRQHATGAACDAESERMEAFWRFEAGSGNVRLESKGHY